VIFETGLSGPNTDWAIHTLAFALPKGLISCDMRAGFEHMTLPKGIHVLTNWWSCNVNAGVCKKQHVSHWGLFSNCGHQKTI
jgi:hypothetical protein